MFIELLSENKKIIDTFLIYTKLVEKQIYSFFINIFIIEYFIKKMKKFGYLKVINIYIRKKYGIKEVESSR